MLTQQRGVAQGFWMSVAMLRRKVPFLVDVWHRQCARAVEHKGPLRGGGCNRTKWGASVRLPLQYPESTRGCERIYLVKQSCSMFAQTLLFCRSPRAPLENVASEILWSRIGGNAACQCVEKFEVLGPTDRLVPQAAVGRRGEGFDLDLVVCVWKSSGKGELSDRTMIWTCKRSKEDSYRIDFDNSSQCSEIVAPTDWGNRKVYVCIGDRTMNIRLREPGTARRVWYGCAARHGRRRSWEEQDRGREDSREVLVTRCSTWNPRFRLQFSVADVESNRGDRGSE